MLQPVDEQDHTHSIDGKEAVEKIERGQGSLFTVQEVQAALIPNLFTRECSFRSRFTLVTNAGLAD